jgi:SAM-dependent methyltransferase
MSLFSMLRQRLRRKARAPFYRSCNFCGGASFRVFRRLPQVGFPPQIHADQPLADPTIGKRLSLQYLECTGCGLIAINPLPRFADIDRTSFDGERNVVAWVDVDWNVYESGKRDVIRIVEEQYVFDDYRRTNRLLDVSCGPGVSLAWLRDAKAWQVDGTDPDQHSVRLAQQRYGLTIHNGLIHQLRAPAGKYDLVLMDNSLEHTFDPLATLLEAYRLLRPGGALFVFVPNSDGLSTIHLGDNVHWGHWFLYSPRALVRMLERIGFRVTRLIAIQNPVNPRLAEVGVDAAAQLDDLQVDLNGVDAVRDGVASRRLVADYFNLLAVKPEDADERSPRDAQLRAIANESRVERTAVRIVTP